MTDKIELEKFMKASRDLEADENETRWDERLKKIVNGKPKPERPE